MIFEIKLFIYASKVLYYSSSFQQVIAAIVHIDCSIVERIFKIIVNQAGIGIDFIIVFQWFHGVYLDFM